MCILCFILSLLHPASVVTSWELELMLGFFSQHGLTSLFVCSRWAFGAFCSTQPLREGIALALLENMTELWRPGALTVSWVKYGPKNEMGSNKVLSRSY